ncbi:non-ribosomal peptide synthetase [Amycolatopsis sacchari]|uniref:non-ribosomal peptide synthetase n=1 Tax=Amycolatopsis sacchari TaxID=115433 RepID=UPI003D718226
MISKQRPAAEALAPVPAAPGGPARRDEETTRSELVGPVTIPRHVIRALDALTGPGEVTALAVCAGVLAARLSPGVPRYALVIRGERETVAAPVVPASLLAALQQPRRRDDGSATDVTFLVSADGRRLFVESMTSSVDAPTARSWARSFLHLLAGMAEDPDRAPRTLPLMDEVERERVLTGLSGYRVPRVRHRTLTAPFEEQAARTPDAVALLDEHGAALTYRQLDERANRLAHFLRERGARPGARVGICCRRGLSQLVALYAAVKTGAAYVPLDAELPDARIGFILEDSAPLHVLTDSPGRLPPGPYEIHDLGDDSPWAGHPVTTPAVEGTAGALLHILYTSGTTGRPKGVAYPTEGALAHLAWMQHRYPFGTGDTAIAKTSPGFDVSVWELFWPLYRGARLLLCEPGSHRDPRHLADLVERYGVTTVFLPPTVITPFLDQVSGERAGALRWVLCGGEPVTPRVRDKFSATLPAATLVNCYGPTEAGNVTDFGLAPDPGAPVPLGLPAANFRITLLDADLEPVPVGTPGEAYIGGRIGLAHGYWGAPARTAERFVADPYGPPGSRLYRTGDLCRYRDDGALEHLGRIDRQLKIRGLRIEPGEIESVLGAHEAVGDCAVFADGEPPLLLAFVVPAGRGSVDDLDPAALGAHAAALLPEHMRPEWIVPVLRIPETVNGKIDKEALLRVWHAHRERHHAAVPPADELEAALAGIYERVLGTRPASVLDTFAQLGGHSLLAFQLLDACEEAFGAKPDVTELLTGTLRDVAASLREAE